jgi:hypothetical protein
MQGCASAQIAKFAFMILCKLCRRSVVPGRWAAHCSLTTFADAAASRWRVTAGVRLVRAEAFVVYVQLTHPRTWIDLIEGDRNLRVPLYKKKKRPWPSKHCGTIYINRCIIMYMDIIYTYQRVNLTSRGRGWETYGDFPFIKKKRIGVQHRWLDVFFARPCGWY